VQQPDLILSHMGYVRGIAGGMVQKHGCVDLFPDLCQEGYLALLHAAERFDETLGLKFWTLASRRVWGAMIDAFRRWHWDGVYTYESTHRGLEMYTLTPLHDNLEGQSTAYDGMRLDMQAALASLDERERYVIIRTYVEGYTLKQVGQEWHLKEAWVCIIRAEGIKKMRAHMEHVDERLPILQGD